MNNCDCNTGYLCLTHRLHGRKGDSADSDIMAANDQIDLPGEVAKLYERLYKHEKEGLEHEKMIATQSKRLSELEKQIDIIGDALLKIAEFRNRMAKA